MSDLDADIVEQVRGGDVAALGKYLEAHQLQLLAYFCRRLGPALQAKVEPDDILQETWTEAVRSLTPELPGEREPFSWLCQLAEHKIIDAHRHHFAAQKRDAGRERSLDQRAGNTQGAGFVNLLVNSMTTPSQAFSRNARELRLQTALAELSKEQRNAVRMKYVESLPSKQIAAALGKSDAAVRVMLTRTIKQLQGLLEEE